MNKLSKLPRDSVVTGWATNLERKRVYLILLCVVGAALPIGDLSLIPFWKRDFLNYWLGPRAIWSGVDPYNLTAYQDFGLAFFPDADPWVFNFTYPPHALVLFAPFAVLPGTVALATWDVLSLAAFYLAARPWLPQGFPRLLAVFTPAALICLQFGQTGLFSAALFLIAFRGSGLAAAVLTFKPHLGFLVAPALLLDSRRALVTAVAATLLLIGLSALVVDHWSAFFEHALSYQGRSLVDQSIVVWVLFGTTPMIGYGVMGLIVYGLPALVILCRNFNVFTAATATFLISPYGFHYDMAAVSLGFAVLLYSYWDEMPLWHKLSATLGYLAPVVVSFGTWWVPPILIIGLYVQTRWFPGTRMMLEGRRLKTRPA